MKSLVSRNKSNLSITGLQITHTQNKSATKMALLCNITNASEIVKIFISGAYMVVARGAGTRERRMDTNNYSSCNKDHQKYA